MYCIFLKIDYNFVCLMFIHFSIRIDGINGIGLIIKCEDCEAKYLYLSGYMLYCVRKKNPIWKHAALIQLVFKKIVPFFPCLMIS